MRWLHISDIHVGPVPDYANYNTFISHFIKEVKNRVAEKAVDCIFFTGDLFHKGHRDNDSITKAKDFFNKLYRECSDAGGWGWEEGKPMDRLYYCPGNHDLLRDALFEDNGIIYRRTDEIKNMREKDQFYQLTSSNPRYRLFTECSFRSFESVMRKITNQEEAKTAERNDVYYEYKLIKKPRGELSDFLIIGLNTALTAGQIPPDSETKEKMKEAYESFLQSHSRFDTDQALSKYKQYHKYAQWKMGITADDFGHLSFLSREATEKLDRQITNEQKTMNYCIPIVFGHHPLDFFSEASKHRFRLFMETNSAHVYLCGHMHRPSENEDHHITQWYENDNFYQIAIGGVFMDESMYNRISFSIGEVSSQASPQTEGSTIKLPVKLTVNIYSFFMNPFQKEEWIKSSEEKPFTIELKKASPPGLQDKKTEIENNEVKLESSSPQMQDKKTEIEKNEVDREEMKAIDSYRQLRILLKNEPDKNQTKTNK